MSTHLPSSSSKRLAAGLVVVGAAALAAIVVQSPCSSALGDVAAAPGPAAPGLAGAVLSSAPSLEPAHTEPHGAAHAIGLSPVAVEWVERALPDGRKELVLVVEKRVATDAALGYEIDVPEALRAQLGSASLSGELPPDFVGKREVKVGLPTAPIDLRSVVARAQLNGQSLSFNARVPARDERSAGTSPNFKREARTARFGGIDLGQAIILDAPAQSTPSAGSLVVPELAPGALPR